VAEDAAAAAPAPGIVQVAYHVPDPAAAAARCAALYGWGPFYLFEHIALARSSYRGRALPFDHSSAYGQAGEVMVELITQHGDAPSAIRERYAADASGLHHTARFAPDLEAALARQRAAGASIVQDAETADGVRFVMLEAPLLGHLLELYEPSPALVGFYDFIRRKARGWDGSRPLRRRND
jgi:hypothetical protein